MSQLTDQFIDALRKLESSRDVETIAALFSEGAAISSPLVHHDHGGPQQAGAFWTHYRDAFDDIRSEFKTVREIDGTAFLEWHSRGELGDQPFEYDGISVLKRRTARFPRFAPISTRAIFQPPRVRVGEARAKRRLPVSQKAR